MSDYQLTPIRHSPPGILPTILNALTVIDEAKAVLEASRRLDPFVRRVIARTDYLRSPDGQAEMRLASRKESVAARAHRVWREFLDTGE